MNRIREAVRLSPIAGAARSAEIINSTGCKAEERKILPLAAGDVVENTTSRSIRTAPKPRRKDLIQMSGFSRRMLMIAPRKVSPSHIRLEKRDRAEHRRKSKIGSVSIKKRPITKSDETAIKNRETPKIKPRPKPPQEGREGNMGRIPPAIHDAKSERIILSRDGSVNNDE
jgi:hypothetical protein